MPRFDVHVQILPAEQFVGTKFMGFAQKRTVGVRGIQKLVDEYAIALLTPLGSDPLNLLRGTDLPALIGSNVAVEDAHDILVLAVDKASQDIQQGQQGRQVPSDERLAAATVTDFITITDAPGFAAQIFIENIVDQGLTFLLPTLEVR